MMTNQRQYLNTQAQAERFRRALLTPDAGGLHPKAAKAMREGLHSQLADLEAELADYDSLRQGAGSHTAKPRGDCFPGNMYTCT